MFETGAWAPVEAEIFDKLEPWADKIGQFRNNSLLQLLSLPQNIIFMRNII
jgi:hypothetical protein